ADDPAVLADEPSAKPPEPVEPVAAVAPLAPVGARPRAKPPGPVEPGAAVDPVAPVAAGPRAKPRRAEPRRAPTGTVVEGPAFWRNRSLPAMAGVAALVVLLLIAGAGFLSQLALGVGAGLGPAA